MIELLRCRHPLLIRLVLDLPPDSVIVHDGCLLVFEDTDPLDRPV